MSEAQKGQVQSRFGWRAYLTYKVLAAMRRDNFRTPILTQLCEPAKTPK
jgi:hypothetical protein